MKKAFFGLLAATTLFTSADVINPILPALAMEENIPYDSIAFVGADGEEMYTCEFLPEFPSICIMIA